MCRNNCREPIHCETIRIDGISMMDAAHHSSLNDGCSTSDFLVQSCTTIACPCCCISFLSTNKQTKLLPKRGNMVNNPDDSKPTKMILQTGLKGC
jgi:hypothetical protein